MPIGDDYYSGLEDGPEDFPHLERILNWYRRYFGEPPTGPAGCPTPAGGSPGGSPGGGGAAPASFDRAGASILVPIGALRALRRLTALSSGRVLVVSGDKGNNNPEQFRGLMDPHLAIHGSFRCGGPPFQMDVHPFLTLRRALNFNP